MIQRIEPGKTMSRAVIRDGLIYFTGHVAAGKKPTMREQAQELCNRYDELLNQFGSDKAHILSATIYVTDISLRPEFNEIWDNWIPEGCAPARLCVEVGLSDGYLVEMTMIAEVVDK